MSLRRLRAIVGLPATVVGWWRRTTTPSPVEHWLMLVGIPAILTLLWLLPSSDRLAFSLAADSIFESRETLVTALTANYVHADARHLFDNLLNFWVTLFGIYPLVSIAGWQREFRCSISVYLLFAPFVIGWLTLLMIGPVTNKPSVGFSGIVAAFLGFLPVVLVAAASEVTDGSVDTAWAAVPVVLSLAVVFAVQSVPYAPIQPRAAVGMGVCGCALAGGFWWRRRPWRLRERFGRLEADVQLAFLIGSTVFVFGITGALLVVGTRTNVWGHLAGYLVGFLVPYLGFVVPPMLTGR